ncbi:hypothetical protein I549_1163 [Mycobacterium avium subsp. avium 2285 (R)]|nr:hypothetical protein I549_1163 [Mycobacterium avium subsp. avium 2285 (R)]
MGGHAAQRPVAASPAELKNRGGPILLRHSPSNRRTSNDLVSQHL